MAEMNVDGHRADIVILKTALAHAAYNQRERITLKDILIAAQLALPHRLKRQPFQDTSAQFQQLSERLEQIREQEQGEEGDQEATSAGSSATAEEKKTIMN
jgi:Mg-chelatase subunit ChlI